MRTSASSPGAVPPRARSGATSTIASATRCDSGTSTKSSSDRIRRGPTRSRSRTKTSRIVPWLVLDHGALDIFLHPNTDDGLRDHRDSATWIGRSHSLNLQGFAPLLFNKESYP
jgi:hypothetical protein